MMQAKALELRDEGTFIPVLCVDMNPGDDDDGRSPPDESRVAWESRRYLLRRVGYPCDGCPNILMTRLSGDGQATNDPYGWKDGTRTFPAAHQWIIEHWNELRDGDVVDVQFILGETSAPKVSERVSVQNVTTTARF